MAPPAFIRLFGRARSKSHCDAGMVRPQDPTRPCPMARLSEDLVLDIFDLVQASSPHSVRSLALVHPRFLRPARYVQHRSVTVDLDNRLAAAARRLDLIAASGANSAVRELHVLSHHGRPNAQCLARLTDMLPTLTSLRLVHWEYSPMAAAVLEALRGLHKALRLQVVVRDDNGHDPAPRQLLAALAGCVHLASITVRTEYLNADGCLELSRPLNKLLLTCPNLIGLSVDMHPPRHGCVMFGPPEEYPGIGFSNGQHPLRPLESLTMHAYPWGEPEPLGGGFLFHSVGYPAAEDEIKYWAAHFDWSALRKLEATDLSTQVLLASALAPKLTALREVCFTWPRDPRGNLLQPFFDRVPSKLEAIDVPNLDSIGAAALARHAPTLRKLVLHRSEPFSPSAHTETWADHLLSPEAIADLADRLPHLEELGIELRRVGGDWPRAHLDALAHFPQLAVLELWFSFDSSTFGQAEPPALTAASAADLFSSLHRATPTLQRLRVHSGVEINSRQDFSGHSHGSYPADNATSFACRVAERDDEAAADQVDVTSLLLSPRLNARMRRILSGAESREHVQENLIALRVALDGPLTIAEWERWRQSWPMPNLPELMDAAEGWTNYDSRHSKGLLSRMTRRWSKQGD